MDSGGHNQGCNEVFRKHIQPILFLKWSKKNELMSCGADNNCYVISFNSTLKKWKGSLVNISGTSLRAMTCCDWSHDGEKLAIGSGTGDVHVGYFDAVNNQWDTVPITGRFNLRVSWPKYYFVSEIPSQRAHSSGQFYR